MSYETTLEKWKSPQDVDWNIIRDALGQYLREVISTFSRQNPEAAVYGIVIVRGQNWELSVYLNTEEGYASMPDRFRSQSRNGPAKTDEEILGDLGRWYYDAWEFDLYEFKCLPEVNSVNNLHYDLFNRLSEDDSVDTDDLSNSFLSACAGAVALLERSQELHTLRKTDDYEMRFFDANCHEWDTESLMATARGN